MHSACFCIRRILKFLMEKHKECITLELSEYLIAAALVSDRHNLTYKLETQNSRLSNARCNKKSDLVFQPWSRRRNKRL